MRGYPPRWETEGRDHPKRWWEAEGRDHPKRWWETEGRDHPKRWGLISERIPSCSLMSEAASIILKWPLSFIEFN
jgi:hypothetical protein